MNQPWVYMCLPSWTLLPPPSPSHPSGSSQCISPEHPVSCIEPGLAIYFTYGNIHVSMLCFRIIPPLPSPTESKSLFFTSVSLLLSHIQGHRSHLSKFHAAAAAAAAKSRQSCPTLCDPTDGSPPGSPVPGILQERTLEWVAISFSNAWKWKVKMKSLSHVQLLATPWTAARQAPLSMGFSRHEYWSGVPLPSPSKFHIYALIYHIGVFLSDLLHSVY